MNYLELVKELAAETGTVSPSQIEDVADASDDHVNDLVRWIDRANHEIELQRDDWKFRIKEGEVELCKDEPVQRVKPQIKDFKDVLPYRHPWRIRYATIERDVFPVRFIPWIRWTGEYDVRVARTRPGRPTVFTVDNQARIRTYPVPHKDTMLKFNYISEAQVMNRVNECTPRMPDRHHRVIVWYAYMQYAGSDEASLKYQTGNRTLRQLMMNLRNEQLPEVRVAV